MKLLLILGPLAGSFLLLGLSIHPRLRVLWDVLAYLCAYGFGIILSLAIYEVRAHDTVFMTEIHEVLMNEVFLAAGAYIGVYGLYMLLRRLALYMRD